MKKMYAPTEEELKQMGFEDDEYGSYIYELQDISSIIYDEHSESWYVFDQPDCIPFFPTTKDQIEIAKVIFTK